MLQQRPHHERLSSSLLIAPSASLSIAAGARSLSRTHTPVPDTARSLSPPSTEDPLANATDSALRTFAPRTAAASCDASTCCDQCERLTSSAPATPAAPPPIALVAAEHHHLSSVSCSCICLDILSIRSRLAPTSTTSVLPSHPRSAPAKQAPLTPYAHAPQAPASCSCPTTP